MRSIIMLGFLTAATALFPPQLTHPASKGDIGSEWLLYKNHFERNYTSDEDLLRQKIYMNTRAWIHNHNQRYFKGEESYSASLNQFSDWTLEEANSISNGYEEENVMLFGSNKNTDQSNLKSGDRKLPSSVDMRTINGIPLQVKDQKLCGSCWAFSATGNIEAMCTKLTGYKYSLSEQELIDCSRPQKNSGCNGGQMTKAFKYIMDTKGLSESEFYPYTGKDERCGKNQKVVKISGFKRLDDVKEEDLMKALATIGVLSIGIDASLASMYAYCSGIYNDPCCNSTNVNHGVLLVGYGTTEDKKDYWIIKNSWGESWGERGYMLLARGNNYCGVLNMVSYATVVKEDCGHTEDSENEMLEDDFI